MLGQDPIQEGGRGEEGRERGEGRGGEGKEHEELEFWNQEWELQPWP